MSKKSSTRLKPPPGGKLVRDWRGLRVRTTRAMSNGWGEIPAGTLATVSDSVGLSRVGIEIRTDPCGCCGVVMSMSALSHDDVEVITPDEAAPGVLHDRLRSLVTGMSVSVDVGQGPQGEERRYFGTVTEVQDDEHDKLGVTLLVQDAQPNF